MNFSAITSISSCHFGEINSQWTPWIWTSTLIINPDFSYRWKDVDDYQKAIENEIIFPEWVEGIE